MAVKKLELYIDESGDFNDTRVERQYQDELSMVGGVLCDPKWLTKAKRDSLLPMNRVHAKDGYKKSYLTVLEDLRKGGCQFVVFENTERIRVVNPQITYANIISEGLVKLFRDLAMEYPGGVSVNVVIAQRQLKLAEYRDRLIEKVYMAYGRDHVEGCSYDLSISDARYDKRLFFADIICNTYLTRNRADKFTDGERTRIQNVFDQQWIYPVFEDATVKYIKQLLVDRHYGEMMYQICTLPRLAGVKKYRDQLLNRMSKAGRTEREHWFSQMSMQIGLYNEARMFYDGIALARNYQRYFLEHFRDIPETSNEVQYWFFDSDFYILTMYDHLGATAQCQKYLAACRENLSSVNRSWEHMDYYFRFRLRELNVLMGRFAFEEVMIRSEQMAESFREVSDVFRRIGERDGTGSDFRSEILGKVQGIRLEALINLASRDPNRYEEALNASDQALREFSRPDDLRRQWQYRSQLMAVCGKTQEAWECLLRSLDISESDESAEETVLSRIYMDGRISDDYTLLHYTNILCLLAEEHSPRAEIMGDLLLKHPRFQKDLKNLKKTGHPWNTILWHTARYARSIGDKNLSNQCYQRALEVTREHPEQLTMMTFAVSITAERLRHFRNADAAVTKNMNADWKASMNALRNGNTPKEMLDWFGLDNPDPEWQARAWLK